MHRLPWTNAEVGSLAFSSDDRTVGLWETAGLKETTHFPLELGDEAGLALSPLGKRIALGEPDGTVRLVEASAGREIARLGPQGAGIEALAFSTNGGALCVSYEDGTAEIFDTATGRRWAFLQGAKEPISGAVLLPDGKTAATADFTQDVKLWDLNTQKELVTMGERGCRTWPSPCRLTRSGWLRAAPRESSDYGTRPRASRLPC